MEGKCQSPNDACHTQTAVEVESSDIDQDHFFAWKPVRLTHGHTVSNQRLGVPPSVKKKHGRPLSMHSSQRLLVKGFTYSQICKRIRKVESSFVKGDRNGCSEKACVASEVIALQSGDIGDSCRLERCIQPQKRSVDGLLLNDEHMSVMRKCGQKIEYGSDSGIAVRTTKGCEKANGLLVDPVDAVIVRRRGRPRKRPLVGSSFSDSRMCVMQENQNANTVVVRRRGRPRKMSIIDASLIGENKLVTTNCGEHEELHCIIRNGVEQTDGLEKAHKVIRSPLDANTVVRKRGRPRKISIVDASLIGENMSVAMKCGEQEELHCVGGNEIEQTDGLEKANEVVRSPPDANTVVRKRGRPRKISIIGVSLTGENVVVATKSGEQEEHQCESGIAVGEMDGPHKANRVVKSSTDASSVVRKCGRPRTRTVDSTSSDDNGMSLLTEYQDAKGAVVRRLGRPCKRPRDDLLSSDVSLLI